MATNYKTVYFEFSVKAMVNGAEVNLQRRELRFSDSSILLDAEWINENVAKDLRFLKSKITQIDIWVYWKDGDNFRDNHTINCYRMLIKEDFENYGKSLFESAFTTGDSFSFSPNKNGLKDVPKVVNQFVKEANQVLVNLITGN